MYKCGGNFFWADPLATVTQVPLRQTVIFDLMEHYFKDPGNFPGAICVAIGQTQNPMDHKGSLRRVSPPEIQWALIFKLKDEIRLEVSEERLKEWRRMLLSCSFHFMLLDNMDDMSGARVESARRLCCRIIFKIKIFLGLRTRQGHDGLACHSRPKTQ